MKETYFCCENMQLHVKETESICYNEAFDEYGILCREDELSVILLRFCPWCGKKLPESKRDAWFDCLEQMGYNDPFSEEIPSKFRTSEWREN
jgi:hypothetical protein